MAKAQPIQTNFTSGELSPRLKGRVDIKGYGNGVDFLENFIILPQGGVYRRSGTRFAGEIKDSSKAGRLVAFEFSTTQAYVLQFENLSLRFYKDEAPITLTPQTIAGISNAATAVLTYVGADTYANGDRVLISGVVGMVEVNNREFTVANVNAGANTFELSGVNSTGYGVWSSGGTVAEIYEVVTTYLEAELPDLQFTQSADVLYIAHQAHAPAQLSRTGHTAWTLTTTTFIDGPYQAERTDLTVTPGGTTGSVSLTASAALFDAGTDVGRQIRLLHGSSWSYATITAVTNSTLATATVGSQATVASASAKFRMGAFFTGNYPQCVIFHEQRLVYANTPAEPQSFWMSYSGAYATYSPTDLGTTTVVDSSAIFVTIVSNKVNAIHWLISSKTLTVGTAGAEWQMASSSLTNEAVTPTNFSIIEQSAWGSRKLQAQKVGANVLFVDRAGRKIREFQYDLSADAYKAQDISLLGEHLLREGNFVTALAYQQSPDSVLWMVRQDGVLVGMTYVKDQEIIGFHHHIFGGAFGAGAAVAESIAVIPTPEGTSDQLWLIVKRTVDGVTRRYVEFMEAPFETEDPDEKDAMFFVDCGLTYDSSATLSVNGLMHLKGQTVAICADAAVAPDEVVSAAGTITLETEAELIQIGLPFVSLLRTLPPEGGNPYGTAQGKQKRVHEATVRLLNTLSLQYGVDGTNWTTLGFRDTADPIGTSPPLFTGDKPLELDSDVESEGDYYIRQANPYPMTIIALMPKYAVTES